MLQPPIQLPDGSDALLEAGVPDQNSTVSFDVYRRAMSMLRNVYTGTGAVAGLLIGGMGLILARATRVDQSYTANPTAAIAIPITAAFVFTVGGALAGRGLYSRQNYLLSRQIEAEAAEEAAIPPRPARPLN